MRKLINAFNTSLILFENSPDSERTALNAASFVAALITSATASACAKSILLFKKARRVNSPGSACRAPNSIQRANKICINAVPPWACSSNTSSPVYEYGFG